MSTPPAERAVLVVEDHFLLAQTLALALTAAGYTVTRLPGPDSRPGLVHLLPDAIRCRPEVVLLDLDLGVHGDGSALIRPLVRTGSRVVVVTGSSDAAQWGWCLHEGAVALVDKRGCLADLLETVRRVRAGELVTVPAEYRRLTALWRARQLQDEGLDRRLARLSRGEGAVLMRLVGGQSVREIAAARWVAETTVRAQVRAVLTKLEVPTQVAAVSVANRAGWQQS